MILGSHACRAGMLMLDRVLELLDRVEAWIEAGVLVERVLPEP